MLFIFISSSFLKLVLSVTLIVHTASQSCSSSSDCTNPSAPGCLGTTCGYCTLNTQCLSLSEPRCLSGSCTSCGSDRDCNDKFPSSPYCGPSSACVNCLSSSQCTYDKPRCTSNTCSACHDSATDCQGRFSVRTLCSGTTGKCVQCNSYTDCTTADAARCGSDGLCAGCTLDTECGARFNGKSKCKSSAGVCVECLSNSDCTSSSGSRCENNVCTTETISKALQDVQGLIQGSNLAKILNYEALYGFDLLRSPLFYIVFGFTLVMLAISIWAAFKDKALDRDLLKLPDKAPSRIYKLIVYILITHTFFCIFVLFEKNSPRVMRSALFYTKIMGLMAVSTIFNQNNQELSSIQRTVLAILTILVTTPINMFASYVAFKRHLQPKIRRKRKERGGRGRVAYVEDISKKNSNFKKSIDTILIILGYISLIIIILGYVYTIFVITANNITANNQIVRKWLNGFLQSIALELFGIQIGKVFLHLGILSALQKSTKKKFLCIPRKYLPKMLNPTIFDFQKRFAVLEQLYKKPKPGSHVSLPLPELEFGDEASSPAPSVNHNGQTSIAMMMGAGFALNDNTSPGAELSVRKKEMLRMRTKMKLPININHEPIEETNKEYVKNERILEELSPRRGKSPVSKQKHKDEVLAKTQRSAKRLRGVTFIKKAAGQEVYEGQKDELQLP